MAKKVDIEYSGIEKALMAIKDYVKKNRKLVLASLVGIIVLVTLLVGFIAYKGEKELGSLMAYEEIMSDYRTSMVELKNDEAKEKKLNGVIEKLESLYKNNSWGYFKDEGQFIIGGLNFKAKKWEKAKNNYIAYAESSSSKFVVFSYLQAGVCEENLKNYDKALEIYKTLKEDYSESEYLDQILYGLGRMYQKKSDLVKAKEFFNQIVNDHKTSLLSRKAKQRLLALSYKK